MAQVDLDKELLRLKLTYVGPPGSGKLTNLNVLHRQADAKTRTDLRTMELEGDRTVFFDLSPPWADRIMGLRPCFQVYAVTGQPGFNATRKMALLLADGVVFVADSRKGKQDENLALLENLEANLRSLDVDPAAMPTVFQWNQRDRRRVIPAADLSERLNPRQADAFEGVASEGRGVDETFRAICEQALESVRARGAGTAGKLSDRLYDELDAGRDALARSGPGPELRAFEKTGLARRFLDALGF